MILRRTACLGPAQSGADQEAQGKAAVAAERGENRDLRRGEPARRHFRDLRQHPRRKRRALDQPDGYGPAQQASQVAENMGHGVGAEAHVMLEPQPVRANVVSVELPQRDVAEHDPRVPHEAGLGELLALLVARGGNVGGSQRTPASLTVTSGARSPRAPPKPSARRRGWGWLRYLSRAATPP